MSLAASTSSALSPVSPLPTTRSPAATSPTRRPPRPDVFRPISKLPLDPFSELDAAEPYTVDAEVLKQLSYQLESRRAVLLLTGDPTSHDIAPLLSSMALSNSLLIIACAYPPPLPDLLPYGPQVRILRLSSSDPGSALKIASLLERAAEIAHSWRDSHDSEERVIQLSEEGGIEGREFSVIEEPVFASSIQQLGSPDLSSADISRLPSPAPSAHSSSGSSYAYTRSPLVTPPPTRPTSTAHSRPGSMYSFFSTTSNSSVASNVSKTSSKSNKSKKTKKKKLKVQHGDVRVFDALINFLPPSARSVDKTVLKGVVLLTTLGGGFLSGRPYGASPSSGLASMGMRTYSSPLSPSTDGAQNAGQSAGSLQRRSSQLRKANSTDALASGNSRNGAESATTQSFSSIAEAKRSRRLSSTLSAMFSRNAASKSAPPSPVLEGLPPSSNETIPPVPLLAPQNAFSASRAHVIHVVPSSYLSNSAKPPSSFPGPSSRPTTPKSRRKPYLIQSIEQFLLSYSYPILSSPSTTSNSNGSHHYPRPSSMALDQHADPDARLKPVAYILPGSVFSTSPKSYNVASIGQIIVSGALDPKVGRIGKAWIGASTDVLVKGANPETTAELDSDAVGRKPMAVDRADSKSGKLKKRGSHHRRSSSESKVASRGSLKGKKRQSTITKTTGSGPRRSSVEEDVVDLSRISNGSSRRSASNGGDQGSSSHRHQKQNMLPTPPESSGSSHDDDLDERVPEEQETPTKSRQNSVSNTISSVSSSSHVTSNVSSENTVPAASSPDLKESASTTPRGRSRSASRLSVREVFSRSPPHGSTPTLLERSPVQPSAKGAKREDSVGSPKKKSRLGLGSLKIRFFRSKNDA